MTTAAPRIGLVGADSPPELVRAAGAVPVRLGRPSGLDAEACERASLLLGATDPAAVAVLAGLLSGSYDVDAVVCSRDREASLRTYYVLRELRARGEALPPVHLVDIVHLPREASLRYDVAQLEQLADVLRGWTGSDPRPGLADACRDLGELRSLLVRLHRRRREGRVSGTRAQLLQEAASVLPAEEAAAGLHSELEAARTRPVDDRAALFLSGSDPLDGGVHRMVEDRGWRVCGEDGDHGALRLTVDVSGDAVVTGGLTALARAYRDRGPDSATSSAAARADYASRAVREAGAAAVLVQVRRHDEGPLWDLPALREQLDAAGVPVTLLRDQDLDPEPRALDAALTRLRGATELAGAGR